MARDKLSMNIVVAGHVDHGKRRDQCLQSHVIRAC